MKTKNKRTRDILFCVVIGGSYGLSGFLRGSIDMDARIGLIIKLVGFLLALKFFGSPEFFGFSDNKEDANSN